ncbi:MAG: DUF3761 domain-containing protein [Bacteroidales bacterium]|nr:DUF3761 domain-containing protein [Bacteroidales bacterium]
MLATLLCLSDCKKPTAVCNDGKISYSKNHNGTCSHHHGVAYWY